MTDIPTSGLYFFTTDTSAEWKPGDPPPESKDWPDWKLVEWKENQRAREEQDRIYRIGQRHMDEWRKNTFGKLECPHCGETRNSRDAFRKHASYCKKKFTLSVFECQSCDYETPVYNNLQRHVREVHQIGMFKCQICNQTFDTRRHLAKHRKVAHEFDCMECTHEDCYVKDEEIFSGKKPVLFSSPDALSRHWREVHGRTTGSKAEFVCEECNRNFSRKCHLERHRMIHMGVYQCKACKQVLPKDDRKEHKDVCPSAWSCTICEPPVNFDVKHVFERHVRVRHDNPASKNKKKRSADSKGTGSLSKVKKPKLQTVGSFTAEKRDRPILF